ncbi:MAG TPA: response regulator [Phycisphaerae bacterium]|nr:response regulator [Phycisphaerales bacterium]HRX84160.1 response regulator [Phycisphaerae bacterium]
MGAGKRQRAVVLLIEDDPGDQELTRRALAGGPTHMELRIVEDGEQALDYLFARGEFTDRQRAPRPDLIILDLNLPRVDGREVLRQIKTDAELGTIPVVVLTTSKRCEDIQASYALGCNSFITKPMELGESVDGLQRLGSYWLELVALPRCLHS